MASRSFIKKEIHGMSGDTHMRKEEGGRRKSLMRPACVLCCQRPHIWGYFESYEARHISIDAQGHIDGCGRAGTAIEGH